MNTMELWSEPKKKHAVPPQVFVAAGLLIALLLGTANWQSAPGHLALGCKTAVSAQNCIRSGS